MATPTSPPQPSTHQSQPLLRIKSAARKLPIKRKTHDPNSDSSNPNPNTTPAPKSQHAYEITVDALAYGDEEDYDDVDVEEDEELEEGDLEGDLVVEELAEEAAAATSLTPLLNPPPFKFQRIWSESDEVRFLQGLLACRSQGMAFPRDLNLFFDRFSETMTQPYTRSQLYEKLRRLRKKFRIVSGRVTRGLDPATALTPQDRDLFHISTQLWHPSYASSSPFSAPSSDNKRRKPNNSARIGTGRPRGRPRKNDTVSTLLSHPSSSSPPPPDPPADGDENAGEGCSDKELEEKKGTGGRGGMGHLTARAIMDVFDSSLKEVRTELVNRSVLYPDMSGTFGDLSRMWREQRVAELDVLARRLRLVLEHAI